jgi:hypothetical protein
MLCANESMSAIYGNGMVIICRFDHHEPVQALRFDNVIAAEFFPDGKRIAIADQRAIQVYDIASGREMSVIKNTWVGGPRKFFDTLVHPWLNCSKQPALWSADGPSRQLIAASNTNVTGWPRVRDTRIYSCHDLAVVNATDGRTVWTRANEYGGFSSDLRFAFSALPGRECILDAQTAPSIICRAHT